MSELRLETWTMPGADLGPENPLPPLHARGDVHDRIRVADHVPDEVRRNLDYGRVSGILPYTMQDGYTRVRHERTFRVAVLENEYLRAAFLLEYGGRLWSLWQKQEERELLYVNPVFQPANLALRNAWFSGGVEWNIGAIGHSPFTCSPLFAAAVQTPEGIPILRMYEWERLRRVPFQIDAFLPDGSPWLFVHVRIHNPHPDTIPMYWWSNIAAPETPHTRVLVPADSAFYFDYREKELLVIPTPRYQGGDYTVPTNIQHSADYFFNIPEGQRPWIAAVGEDGRGLIQTSTPRLRGRKLFLWGMGAGGRRWQRFLSQPGEAYIEIQAGLARTQMEHLPMPAGAAWTWLEAYGGIAVNPDRAHGADWHRAWREADSRLQRTLPAEALEEMARKARGWQDIPPSDILQPGSGWGALERVRRERAGEPPFAPPGIPFPDESLTEAQQPWLTLLNTGVFPDADPESPPVGFMTAPAWREMLERSAHQPAGDHWFAWLHVGVMRFAAGDLDGAAEAWQRSLARTPTPWALRNLAVLDRIQGRLETAADRYEEALQMCPDLPPLAVECARAQIEAGRPERWLAILDVLPDTLRARGRIRLLEGQAALAAGDLDRVAAILSTPFVVDDMREGEKSLSDLWVAYHRLKISRAEGIPIDDLSSDRVLRDHPIPPEFDFRMKT